MGYATTRVLDRIPSVISKCGATSISFDAHQGLRYGGLMLLIPALISQGLLKSAEVYDKGDDGYYPFETIMLTLALMALARIKNPEQLKNCKHGEMGRILGIDRIPETKHVRTKIKSISDQNKSWEWNKLLLKQWQADSDLPSQNEGEVLLYIDGHVRIYHGHQANLPTKFISRQKLCLSATSEYWVNDQRGMPLMMVLGELSEKLQQVIVDQIIPKLIESEQIKQIDPLSTDQTPQCTLVFDREAYDFGFFEKLWNDYRIAFITYRKNVKDLWDEVVFQNTEIQLSQGRCTMLIYEQEVLLGGQPYREIRKLNANAHQTAVVTNHPTLSTQAVAKGIFSRWTQENFFKYMIEDYDFDKLVSYGVEAIEPLQRVVNPQYRRLNNQLKKIREKISRRKAKLYEINNKINDETIDHTKRLTNTANIIKIEIDTMQAEEASVLILRKEQPTHINLAQMAEPDRYNKLKTESKIFMNIIKMVCYRAETSIANILASHLADGDKEKRMLVKQIIDTPVDILPDIKNKTLTITLHSLSANRYNRAVKELIKVLNQAECTFPETDLIMFFKTTA